MTRITAFRLYTRRIYVFSLLAALFAPISVNAQFNYKAEGIVMFNGKLLPGADVLLENSQGDVVKETTTNSQGAYSLNLSANDEFVVVISKVGFTQFKILYSTMGFSDDQAKKFKGSSKPQSELFQLPDDPGTIAKINSEINKPFLSYYYSSEQNEILSDESFEEDLSEQLAKVAKLAGTQSGTIETNYKNAIAKADKAFGNKEYENAKKAYNEALTIKSGEQYPKTKLAEIDKVIADAAEKEKADKEKALADAAEKDRLAKEKALADAATKANAEKEKAMAAAAEKERLAMEKALADAAVKEKADKEKADADAAAKAMADKAEKDRIAKEQAMAEAAAKEKAAQEEKDRIAKEKALAEAAEKDRIAKEKALADAAAKEKSEKEKAAAEAAEKERLTKEKEKADAIAKEKAEREKAIADALEKERLAKEAEEKALNDKYNAAIAKGDAAVTATDFSGAKTAYLEAQALKPKETLPAEKIKTVDLEIEKAKQALYTNELAKKYPQGITEEISKEGNVKITKRIVVQGNKGNLYIKKETSFGAVYYFKDEQAITEQEFKRDTEGNK